MSIPETQKIAISPNFGVDFRFLPMYNNINKRNCLKIPIIKLIYYNIKNNFCQERKIIMEDPDPFAIRQLIINTLEECTDIDLLDLVYKLLIANSTYSGGF